MINLEIIQEKILNGQEGLIDIEFTEDILINGYSIKKDARIDRLELRNPVGKVMTIDSPDYITEYASELLNIDFNSILVGGLGIGVIPYVVQDFAQVDVLEIDQDIIDVVNQLGHLNENVNIIKDDIFTFSTEKTYDVVILDIWYEPLTVELSDQLIQKYLPLVKEGGFLYIPINARSLDDKVKIYPAPIVTP